MMLLHKLKKWREKRGWEKRFKCNSRVVDQTFRPQQLRSTQGTLSLQNRSIPSRYKGISHSTKKVLFLPELRGTPVALKTRSTSSPHGLDGFTASSGALETMNSATLIPSSDPANPSPIGNTPAVSLLNYFVLQQGGNMAIEILSLPCRDPRTYAVLILVPCYTQLGTRNLTKQSLKLS
jgi:hypothetical protein